jgi:predicted nucleotidyltransferase
MKNLAELKNVILKNKYKWVENYHLKSIGIFGSYVNGNKSPESDVDILVDFSSPIDLFSFLELEEELEILCSTKVDLVSVNSLKPHIGKHILSEVEYI